MELNQQQKDILKEFESHAGWQLIKKIRDEILMETIKKQMQEPTFDPTSEESRKMMEEMSLFAKQQKVYEDILRSHTLFTYTPNIGQQSQK